MNRAERDPSDVWLPTTNQIVMASERAILAALDAALLLAARTLEAEHATLGEESHEEPPPPHLALAESIVILAASLRELIAGYRAATDHILGDG
jgi:hypothetical protein